MTLDELQRESAQRPGTAVDLLQLIAHGDTSKHKVELRPDGLRTLSGARIRHATFTGLDGAPSWRDQTRGSCQPPVKRLRLCDTFYNWRWRRGPPPGRRLTNRANRTAEELQAEREVRHYDAVACHAHTYEDGCFANRSTHSSEQNQYVFLLKWRSPAARFVSTCILQTGSIAYSREKLDSTISYRSTG